MTDIQALGRARESFARRAWAESYRLFQEADGEAPLEPEDLEGLRRQPTSSAAMTRARRSERARIRHSSIEATAKGAGERRRRLIPVSGEVRSSASSPGIGVPKRCR